MKNKIYVALVTFFSVIFILTVIISTKLFAVPFTRNFYLPVGMITYPLTFFLGNLVTEVYGKQNARFMIYVGFGAALFTYLLLGLALIIPSSDLEVQRAFEIVFSLNGLIIFGSLSAYLISQTLEISLFAYIKNLTNGKHLWLRNNVATFVSQLVDTFIANWILLYIGMELEVMQTLSIIMVCYLYKIVLTVCGTPVFCSMVYFIKAYIDKNEHVANEHVANVPATAGI